MKISILGFCLLGSLSTLFGCQQIDKRTQAMMEDAKNQDVQMNFYGKVLDQHERPVPDAEVVVHVTKFAPVPPYFTRIPEITVKTDAQGYFSLLSETGHHIGIERIQKKGFEYSYTYLKNSKSSGFEYYKKNGDSNVYYDRSNPRIPDPRIPDSSNPHVYHLRKIGETTFVKNHELGFKFAVKDSGKERGIDVIRGWNINFSEMKTLVLNEAPLQCDLKAEALWNMKHQTWSLTLTAGTPGGGLIVSSQLLYEAPKEGYLPTFTFAPGDKACANARYIYFRSRHPFIYSRLDFNDRFNVNEWPFVHTRKTDSMDLSVGGIVVTNPYGERNFEEAKGLPIEIRKKLQDEVNASYRFNPNGRPPKPDLSKRIQEWEKSRPLTEKLKSALMPDRSK